MIHHRLEMAQEDRLEIYTLGGLRLLLGGRQVNGLRLRKAQALLVYLASVSRPQSRDLLANLFWGESSQERAMANLRDALHLLHKHLEPVLHITRETVGLNPEARPWLDAVEMESALELAHEREGGIDAEIALSLEQAVKLYQGDFLEGFHLRNAPDFEHWLVVERERLRQAVLDALSELVEFHLAQGSYKVGIRFARRILQLEPLMEAGQRQLMRLLVASGQPGIALAAYQSYQQMLISELGVEPTEETRELYDRLLRGEPLPGLPAGPPQHNLSAQSTSFIGRERELEFITQQLEDPTCRLLTLVGVGGMGKSRLAVQAAAESIDRYPDGVWQVELAALNQADLLAQEVAAALGVSAQESRSGRNVVDVLVDYLGDKHLLLVLDNCEHLVETCATLAEILLNGCPQIQVMATSRESLEVSGERIYQVPALEVPPKQNLRRQLENYAAIRLFVERANAVRPGFRLTADNGPTLARICRSLDGVPLAIELAAARVRVLSLAEITERLQDRFRLLTGGPRTALPRNQTLRASMDWSYGLLSEAERVLLTRLSVFSGGWSLEAAGEVGQVSRTADKSALDLLTLLVDKSLVMVETNRRAARYRLLETVRQYGVEKLSEAGETRETNKRHANFFADLAEMADPQLRGSKQVEWLETLDLEHDNLRAALGWCAQEGEANLAYRLVGALGWFWFMRGHWSEAQRWLDGALSTGEDSSPLLRAKAVYRVRGLEIVRGNLGGNVEPVEEALVTCRDHGDLQGIAWCLNILGQAGTWRDTLRESGHRRLLESIDLFRQLEDDWGVAWSHRYLAQMAEISGNFKESIRLHKEALKGFEEVGDAWSAAHSLFLMGSTNMDHGDLIEAKRAYEQCLAKCDIVGDRVMVAHALRGLGETALRVGDSAQAGGLFQEAVEVFQSIGDEYCYAQTKRGLGRVALNNGEFDRARELLKRSLHGFQELQIEGRYLALTLGEFASLAESMGDARFAAKLLAATEKSLDDGIFRTIPFYREERRKTAASTIKRLGQEDFDLAWQAGSALSLEEAVDYALNSTSGLAGWAD